MSYLDEDSQRYFPKSARSLSGEIARLSPALRKTGLAITKKTVNGKRLFCLEWFNPPEKGSAPRAPDDPFDTETSDSYITGNGAEPRAPYVHLDTHNVHPEVHKVQNKKNHVHQNETVNHAGSDELGAQGACSNPIQSGQPKREVF